MIKRLICWLYGHKWSRATRNMVQPTKRCKRCHEVRQVKLRKKAAQ